MTMLEQGRLLGRLLRATPTARRWIGRTLRAHHAARRPVSTFGFRRLQSYFPDAMLEATGVVVVDECPRMPMSEWGLPDLDERSLREIAGITFLDTFFVQRDAADESLFFHEMIHVAQWRRLGFFRFALLYGVGLSERGYRDSPLEETAYRLQHAFDRAETPFDAVAAAEEDTDYLVDTFRRAGPLPRAVWAMGAWIPPPRA